MGIQIIVKHYFQRFKKKTIIIIYVSNNVVNVNILFEIH